jgi:hypothetical protein
MKPQHRIKTVEEVPLSRYEQSIEDAIDESVPIEHASPELMAEVRVGLAELAVALRGGKRPGSGRKPRESRRTMVLLSPTARARLEELAKQTGSLSSAVEKAIMALRA